MLRLPWFEFRAPRTVAEAAKILAGEGPQAMLIAGGTDLIPNMKRRHQSPQTLVSLRGVKELRTLNGAWGAGLTLTEIQSILELKGAGATSCEHTRAVLEQHLAALDEQVERLHRARRDLAALAERAAGLDPSECTDPNRCQVIGEQR